MAGWTDTPFSREEEEQAGALLKNEALLRRVLEREPLLVSRIVSDEDFLAALFSLPEALRRLLRAPVVRDDYQFDQLLSSVGGDGASLRTPPSGKEARLLHLLNESKGMGRLFRKQSELVAAVVANPAFVELVKVRKPHFYRALLDKAKERFGKDGVLVAEIEAERATLGSFTSEGGRVEPEAERRQREACEDAGRLLEAVKAFRTDDVRLLLERGANPNLQNKDGWTALMYAAGSDRPLTVRLLLERGANPNLQDKGGWTALMYAVRNDYAEVVRLLLERGANPNLQNGCGKTARQIAGSGVIFKMLAAAEQKAGLRDGPGPERYR